MFYSDIIDVVPIDTVSCVLDYNIGCSNQPSGALFYRRAYCESFVTGFLDTSSAHWGQHVTVGSALSPLRLDGATTDLLQEVLSDVFNFSEFRPHQLECAARVMAGGDVMAILPTGGGKSMLFQLPMLAWKRRDSRRVGIVLSPLISLMRDQVQKLQAVGVNAKYITSEICDSSTGVKPVTFEEAFGNRDSPSATIVYATPEAICGSGRPSRIKELLDLQDLKVSIIAIDEAHCISEWGHDFRPKYQSILNLRQQFPYAPCIAVTATANERVKHDIAYSCNIDISGGAGFFETDADRPNLSLRVLQREKTIQGAIKQVAQMIVAAEGCCIVYCITQREVEATAASLLAELNQDVCMYHAGMPAPARNHSQEQWMSSAGTQIMVATTAFGMGVDKPDVRAVVHLGMPQSLTSYYQEIGRAGRDGKPSVVTLLWQGVDAGRWLGIRRNSARCYTTAPAVWHL